MNLLSDTWTIIINCCLVPLSVTLKHIQAALEDSSVWTVIRLTTDLVTCPWSFAHGRINTVVNNNNNNNNIQGELEWFTGRVHYDVCKFSSLFTIFFWCDINETNNRILGSCCDIECLFKVIQGQYIRVVKVKTRKKFNVKRMYTVFQKKFTPRTFMITVWNVNQFK